MMDPNEPRHPIRVVSERTGLSPDVLRAWEKRYGAVVPPRREGASQRLYSDADVDRLRLLRQVTAAGRAIGQVAGLDTDQLRVMAREDETARASSAAMSASRADRIPALAATYHARAMEEVRALNPTALESVLMRALVALDGDTFVHHVAVPLLRRIGDAWAAGELGVAHEHAASAVMRRVVAFATDAAEVPDGAREIVVATPAHQTHELGAQLAAMTAAAAGWRVTFLGADCPAEAIAEAVVQRGAEAVALGIVQPNGTAQLADELRRLRAALPPHVEVYVGGAGAGQVADEIVAQGGRLVSSLEDFRAALDGRELAAR